MGMPSSSLSVAALMFIATISAIFLVRLVRVRLFFRSMPGPPHNFFLGHLPAIARIATTLPRDAWEWTIMTYLHQKMELGDFFYLDTWPFGPPTVFITNPEIAAEVDSAAHYTRHPYVTNLVGPIVGSHSILTASGAPWKSMRSMFNPGFAHRNLQLLIEDIVEETTVFCNKLSRLAEQREIFEMEHIATLLTFDVIGRAVLDEKFGSQTSPNELVLAFQKQLSWLADTNPVNIFDKFNFLRPVMNWWYHQKVEIYLRKQLASRTPNPDSKKKYVIDLALETYRREKEGNLENGSMKDSDFTKMAIGNMKAFLGGGHDTTSSTICYIYYLLSKNPTPLQRVREEHDTVFGKDLDKVAELFKTQPHLLDQLPYTTAVIKEVLRIYPIAGSGKLGADNIVLKRNGKSYPTKGMILVTLNPAISRRPDIYDNPEEFHPERFMAPSSVGKESWRPFGRGPMRCIGQELATMEMRIVMVVTLRQFDFKDAYDEIDRAKSDTNRIKKAFGDRGYQIGRLTGKANLGMPMRATKRTVSP
ncbi:hypothetical protein MMC08_002401 [Hypocenomyce scalaris]|nr:hypothetical protein [Hypocenomyce scalaris]